MSVPLLYALYPPLVVPWWGSIMLNFWLKLLHDADSVTPLCYPFCAKTRLIRTKRDKVGEFFTHKQKPRYF